MLALEFLKNMSKYRGEPVEKEYGMVEIFKTVVLIFCTTDDQSLMQRSLRN